VEHVRKIFSKGPSLLHCTDFRDLKNIDDFFVGMFSRIYSIKKSNSEKGLKWKKHPESQL